MLKYWTMSVLVGISGLLTFLLLIFVLLSFFQPTHLNVIYDLIFGTIVFIYFGIHMLTIYMLLKSGHKRRYVFIGLGLILITFFVVFKIVKALLGVDFQNLYIEDRLTESWH